ncbi:FimV/HubP family polar landmark protein [uncultured Psychromonas sp.]|uniref:FimV/HubP family polar landmark protein n=1 Tax=uncultured Psychromonas sp. TaxID=173974 RepID=UPI0026264CBB|nr:FimV/HubP family polar landmark protein [uncultured Psychromonas sp.]
MKRILLSLIFCSPLLFNVPLVQSVDLVGPNDQDQLTQPAETIQAPSSNTTSTPATSPVISKYGPISSRETLWSIASKLRPDSSVSVFQTLVAIYKANPSAFYQSDINRIIPRSVITIPNKAFIAQQTNKEAEQLLRPRKPAPKVIKPVVKKEIIETAPVEPVITKTEKLQTQVNEDETNKIEAESTEVVEPEIIDQLKKEALDKASALEAKNKLLVDQEKEFQLLSEQLIVATEANQSLKLKLQPLTDQVNSLAQQVEEDIATQEELQAIIDQYRQQIEAFEEPPFSGPGLLNEILRTMTASISSLMLTILAPLLFLIAVFLIFLRLKSKRELASREQEIAESTSILMEEDGQFDSLLTDDLDEDEVNEEISNDIEFTEDVELAAVPLEAEPQESTEDESSLIAESDSDFDIVDSEIINDNEVVDDNEVIELASPDDTEIESSVIENNDEFTQPETNEDDPFGIAELIDSEDFDIDSLIEGKEEVIELSEVDLSLDADINQEDLDLAAEWETQLAKGADTEKEIEEDVATSIADTEQNEVDTEEVKPEDVSETVDNIDSQIEQEAEVESEAKEDIASEAVDDIDALLEQEAATETKPGAVSETVDDIDPIINQEVEAANETVVESAELVEPTESVKQEVSSETADDIDELINQEVEAANETVVESTESGEPTEAVKPETSSEAVDDIDELINQEVEAANETVVESTEPTESDESSETVNTDDIIDDDLSEFENVDLSTLKSVDQSISELDAAEEAQTDVEQLSDQSDDEESDDQVGESEENSLAEQLSQGAFDEDAELPTIDKSKHDEFIDIDTLLTSSGGATIDAINEDDFNLEFGLDEFPDVVESFTEFDSDDDGMAAQLDLARAYLEIDEKEGAKDILNKLLTTASDDKLKEVQKLLARIK